MKVSKFGFNLNHFNVEAGLFISMLFESEIKIEIKQGG